MRKITKIDIVTRPSKLDELKAALNAIGVMGITVSQVYGCGTQKGHIEVYRGKEYKVNLLPHIKVETVVIETAMRICQTGEPGDGKIFVFNVEDAVRIRTGDRGAEAIMDEKEPPDTDF